MEEDEPVQTGGDGWRPLLRFGGDEKFMLPSAAARMNQRRIRLHAAASSPWRPDQFISDFTRWWKNPPITDSKGGSAGSEGEGTALMVLHPLQHQNPTFVSAGDVRGRSLCAEETINLGGGACLQGN